MCNKSHSYKTSLQYNQRFKQPNWIEVALCTVNLYLIYHFYGLWVAIINKVRTYGKGREPTRTHSYWQPTKAPLLKARYI